ncbi:flagellar biosynthesis protein FlhF [Serpentinicella sp. ANB-PHB4]|uniref:flagellar biosynthesis protein FlhF n=1 Tax=Serpentinicella sp. ANB-PHB4 TaxID=3074076 RepID=UPI00285C0AD2|nr:flagellar biosynthesis protein FlhF [Serpentinicella sp. ANB-PHB4]MDR5658249.1 flagellar biosynthesis protein FlhF [Serpentinicella sp. ANB-PHB4]
MKVKKFIASNNYEAMQKVKKELGTDAVILHQRTIKPKGFFGLFKKPNIEIVAAREEQIIENKKTQHVKSNTLPEENLIKKVAIMKQENKKSDGLDNEITEIKEMLQSVMKKMPSAEKDIRSHIDDKFLDLYDRLVSQEIYDNVLNDIINDFSLLYNNKNDFGTNEQVDFENFKLSIEKYIKKSHHEINGKIVFFVGPTGVGKTTTIAKLAAKHCLKDGKKVGLISADTYRIAAVEQLKTYCNILNMPMEVIYSNGEIHEALNKLKDCEMIMIDTAGRSHKNNNQINELKDLIDEVEEKEIYLVMSCTTRNNDLKEIINIFNVFDDYNIIFTKSDEASSFGSILNVAYETQKPLSYLTTGQSVPDDIEILNAETITRLLLKEEHE